MKPSNALKARLGKEFSLDSACTGELLAMFDQGE